MPDEIMTKEETTIRNGVLVLKIEGSDPKLICEGLTKVSLETAIDTYGPPIAMKQLVAAACALAAYTIQHDPASAPPALTQDQIADLIQTFVAGLGAQGNDADQVNDLLLAVAVQRQYDRRGAAHVADRLRTLADTVEAHGDERMAKVN